MSESNKVLGANAVLAGTELRNAELRNRIIEGVNLTLKAINECLENAECVQDIEKCVEQQKVLYNVYKDGICKERGFTIEECNDIIKKFNIEEVEWDKVDEIIEAKKMDIIEKNLAIFEDISYEDSWGNYAKLIKSEDELVKYIDSVNRECGFDEIVTECNFTGIGYYDYHLDGYITRIAGLDYVNTDDMEDTIASMDEEIHLIRARVRPTN
jgi:hypothetical protein